MGIGAFADWYVACTIAKPATAECVADLTRFRAMLDDALGAPFTEAQRSSVVAKAEHSPPPSPSKPQADSARCPEAAERAYFKDGKTFHI